MSQQSAQETKLQVSKQELQAAEAKLQAAEAKLQAAEAKLQAAEASKNESLITSARAILSSTTDGVVTAQGAVKTAQDAVTYWSNLLYSSPAVPVLASPRSKSSQSSSSSDGSGEFSLKIHSPEIDGRTINIEVINRGTASKHQRLRHESGKIMGSKQILAEIAAIKTHLEKSEARRIAAETELKQERQQREAERAKFETEFKQVMAQLQQKEQTLVSVQAAATDQANTSNQQVTHHKAKQEQKQGPSLMSRIRAWRSPSRRGPSYTGPASTPTTFASSSPLSVPSSPPNTPPHRATTSAASSPLSTQLMSPGTTATTSSSSPHCPVCHEPIDDDLYEMVECKHLFHLACARFVWHRQHRREETPYCVFPGCNEPVKHSPTKRLARIVEESSSRSDSDISDPSHRSIGQTNPSFDRQSIGSQDTVVSQATSTESNQSQPLTNVTHNTVAFSSSSSSSSSSNSASTSTSTSAPTQEHKQPPTIVASTGSGPASSSDA